MMLSELVSALSELFRALIANPLAIVFVAACFALYFFAAAWLFKVLVLRRGLVVLAVAGVLGILVAEHLWTNDARIFALMLSVLLLYVARAGYLRLIEQGVEEE